MLDLTYEQCRQRHQRHHLSEWTALDEFIARDRPCAGGWVDYLFARSYADTVAGIWELVETGTKRWFSIVLDAEMGIDSRYHVMRYLGIRQNQLLSRVSGTELQNVWEFYLMIEEMNNEAQS